MKQIFPIHDKWLLFQQSTADNDTIIPAEGIPVTVPGTVHTDLLEAGLIEDPFYGDNERSLQWIAERNWKYTVRFDLPETFSGKEVQNLVFDGLDTVADIRLNGTLIGTAQNMFRKYFFNIKTVVNKNNNLLEVYFTSPLTHAHAVKKSLRQFPSARHPERAFLRKAQYSFGWDWGPAFPTMGIWRPVYLEGYDIAKIGAVYFETSFLEENKAGIKIRNHIHGTCTPDLTLHIRVTCENQVIKKVVACGDSPFVELNLEVNEPRLWWPRGYGEPNLYRLDIVLMNQTGEVLDRIERKVGIRTISLELKNREAKAFRFRVNNELLYLKGANWIPADSFLPRVKEDTYNRLLNLAGEAHMNVIRVWGGGIYEEELFYELCDQLGLLVWQDFMFACAAYPEDVLFIEEVKREIEDNVTRLQHHPSILIWCGNNENEWIQYRDQCGPVDQMPGFSLFHMHIPEWLKVLDPSRPYWPSSPFGEEKDPNDPRSGNHHQWDVWSYWMDYTKVVADESLFITEFGFQGPANFFTFKKYLPESALYPQSELFEFHNKQEEGPERIFRFLSTHLPVHTGMHDFIYLTQLNQAFALKACLEHWRLRRPDTSGSIIWQLNDCWPVTSWSLIDSELNPKLAWHEVRRTFANPFIAFLKQDGHVKVYLEGFDLADGTVDIIKVDSEGKQQPVFHTSYRGDSSVFRKRLIYSMSDDNITPGSVYVASVFDHNKTLKARNYFTARPWKYQKLADAGGSFKLEPYDKKSIAITASLPLFFVQFIHPILQFTDNGFILLEEESKIIGVSGGTFDFKKIDEITVFHLNDYLRI